MSALFSALLWLILLLLLIIIVMISLPVRLDARFNSRQKPALNLNIALLGGFLPIPVKTGETTRKQKKEKKKRKKSRKPVAIRPVLRAIPRLLSSLLGSVKLETLHADIVYGFPDPADTGMSYGFVKPLEYWIGRHDPARLTILPDFERAKLDGNGQFVARFTPIALLPTAVRFGWAAFIAPRFKR